MQKGSMDNKVNPLRSGLMELAVLTVIGSGRVYAADILQQLSTTPLATKEGTLYPLLSRLRREGAITYEWAESASGPPRKYYRLTDYGRTHLFQLNQYWRSLAEAIDKLGTSKHGDV